MSTKMFQVSLVKLFPLTPHTHTQKNTSVYFHDELILLHYEANEK